MTTHPPTHPTTQADFAAARRYLLALATGCREGADSPDPRVTVLASAVVAHAGKELEATA